uniref:Cysteine-rich membrane protein 2 n=1 Tax=Spironucleus salmonicida TaxID=348837 RepID=V6M3T1_9EUKA|eukprot:EST47964.1 Cysteine-rich membrane protein 2 [Spironucleus salmonicida]
MVVDCQPCSETMVYDQSCYCEDNKPIYNCLECKGKQCSKCVPKTFLQNNKCEDCPFYCDICSDANSCIMCFEGYEKNLNTGICEQSCKTTEDCLTFVQGFCSPATSTCQYCIENCVYCSSGTTCDFCYPNRYITTVEGQCTKKCENIVNGQYCDNGVPKPCGEDLTSECKCGKASNCASCNEDGDKCKTCLPHVKFNSKDECTECKDGYELRSNMCWLSGNQDAINRNSLVGGTITGIIVAILIVVGGLCVGTFLFLKKRANSAPVKIINNIE